MNITNHKIQLSIILYVFTIATIWVIKPSILFNENGDLKEFGINRYNKTILPFWIVVILSSILSYFIFTLIEFLLLKNNW
jgi:hypothetical protein